MKESYSEELAIHTDLESCAFDGNMMGEALTEVCIGRAIELRNQSLVSGADLVITWGRLYRLYRNGKVYRDSAESKTPCMCRNTPRGNRHPLQLTQADRAGVCIVNHERVLQ